ncbi:MAG: hypothetical protein HY064_04500 [Bacteroidetes bacterium]|nr:hypothetical protein [Bacteroidota bacterium]
METTSSFSESQRFKQIWLWVLMLIANGIFLFGIYWQVIAGHPFGNKPAPNVVLYIGESVVALMTLMFLLCRLNTGMDSSGFTYTFYPFLFSKRKIDWENVQHVYTREYRPLMEFGGWGIRWAGKQGWCYNTSGKNGIQFVMKNNKRILFGTQKMEEAEKVLKQLGKWSAEK